MIHRPDGPAFDLPTMMAIGALVWAVSNGGHEIVGHGGACLAVGCEPTGVSSSFLFCDLGDQPGWKEDVVVAAGVLWNLLLAAFGAALARRSTLSAATRYFGWSLLAVNLFYTGSYIAGWFFGPTLDWAIWLEGREPPWAWRAALTATGLTLVAASFHVATRMWSPFLGGEGSASRRWRMALPPYVAAILVKVAAGLLNTSDDRTLVLLGSFGATGIFLVWMLLLPLYDRAVRGDRPGPVLGIPRSPRWWLVSAIVSALFVLILGRGLGATGPV